MQSILHRIRSHVLRGVRRASVLANFVAVLVCPIFLDDEASDPAHDQIPIRALQRR